MAERSPNYGTDWRADEIALVVSDYFEMLDRELQGLPYSKSEHRRRLAEKIDRTDGSIEFKRENISAALSELGIPWINGYKPAPNYQAALLDAIERYIDDHPQVLAPSAEAVSATSTVLPHSGIIVLAPPPLSSPPSEKSAPLRRLARKFDPAARDALNRSLGREGEQFVVDFEKWRLRDAPQLAQKIRWVSNDDGDGTGYDVLSFDERGHDKLIEVKTTCGGDRTPFFLTRNEQAVASERPDVYRIYRVFQFRNDRRIFTIAPPLGDALHLETAIYSATPR